MAACIGGNSLRFLINSRISASFSGLRHGISSRNHNINAHHWPGLLCKDTRSAEFILNRKQSISSYANCYQPQSIIPFTHFSGKAFLRVPSPCLIAYRGVTLKSKKGKRKTCKAVAKRFIRTGKGKLKRWRCGYHHNQTKKTGRRKRFLRKPTYANKTQLKTLNKMLNGW